MLLIKKFHFPPLYPGKQKKVHNSKVCSCKKICSCSALQQWSRQFRQWIKILSPPSLSNYLNFICQLCCMIAEIRLTSKREAIWGKSERKNTMDNIIQYNTGRGEKLPLCYKFENNVCAPAQRVISRDTKVAIPQGIPKGSG